MCFISYLNLGYSFLMKYGNTAFTLVQSISLYWWLYLATHTHNTHKHPHSSARVTIKRTLESSCTCCCCCCFVVRFLVCSNATASLPIRRNVRPRIHTQTHAPWTVSINLKATRQTRNANMIEWNSHTLCVCLSVCWMFGKGAGNCGSHALRARARLRFCCMLSFYTVLPYYYCAIQC